MVSRFGTAAGYNKNRPRYWNTRDGLKGSKFGDSTALLL